MSLFSKMRVAGLGGACLLLSLFLVLPGCDSTGADSGEAPLEVIFERTGKSDASLGRFEAPWQPRASLESAAQVEIPSVRSYEIWTEGSEADSNAVVFVLFYAADEPFADRAIAFAYAPGAGGGPRFAEGNAFPPGGSAYAFMIEGIGATASQPVDVTIRVAEAGWMRTLTVDPESHVLTSEAVLHVGYDDFRDPPPACGGAESFRFIVERAVDPKGRDAPALPIAIFQNPHPEVARWHTSANTLQKAQLFGALFPQGPCEEFTFHLFMLEPPA